ncbi:hypothetical protein [Chryseobacterium aureum]|uniref:hypothetical protein n=1 Tax=Chryseobacterium aureum TaxID=2497456 RepID=UPI000F88B3FF|nr:hypothetical protein [Chryseobacterium aureum]
MVKINSIKGNLQAINIYDRHTLEKFMLGKNITIFDLHDKIIKKIKVEELLIPVEKELTDKIDEHGFMHWSALNLFNGCENAQYIRIINYFDFIEQKNNYSEILLHDFKTILSKIEADLEDYVFDNSQTSFSDIKDFVNNELLQQFFNCKDTLNKKITLYKLTPLVFKDPIIFYIDNQNMKKISVLFSKAIARIIEQHKKYIDRTSTVFKVYEEEYKFLLKKEKKYKKGEEKHEDNIKWEDIFKDKATYKQFVKYAKKHIINGFIDYSFLFQKLKYYELIHNHTHFKYIDWLNDNNFITEKDYEEFVKNAGFRSLSKSYSEQRENNFNNIFDM